MESPRTSLHHPKYIPSNHYRNSNQSMQLGLEKNSALCTDHWYEPCIFFYVYFFLVIYWILLFLFDVCIF